MVDLSGVTPLRAVRNAQRAQEQVQVRQPARIESQLAGKSLPQLASLAAELSSAPPPVDQARIAEVRASISGGSYQLDPDRIARALLGNDE